MAKHYRVRHTEQSDSGIILAIIDGPGIGRAGVHYSFESFEELDAFVNLLNRIRNQPVPIDMSPPGPDNSSVSPSPTSQNKKVLGAGGTAG
jgi:hypothetical protein